MGYSNIKRLSVSAAGGSEKGDKKMFQRLAVDEYYYQKHLEVRIQECITEQYPGANLSVTGFICAGKNYFCVQDSTQNSKIVFNSDLQEMFNFCVDSVSGCSDCTEPHIFETQDIPAVELQIRKNLVKIMQSGSIQPKNDSFNELRELAENHVLVKLPSIEHLGHYNESNSESEYYYYVKLLVKTALLCTRILDYIKYGIKVVADRAYEEELMEYKEKMKEILLWENPQKIYELNLSRFAVSLLLRANISTVQELRELPEETLAGIRGIGRKSLQEIIEMRELLLGKPKFLYQSCK